MCLLWSCVGWFCRNLSQGFAHGLPISGKLSFCVRMSMFLDVPCARKLFLYFQLYLKISDCAIYWTDINIHLV